MHCWQTGHVYEVLTMYISVKLFIPHMPTEQGRKLQDTTNVHSAGKAGILL